MWVKAGHERTGRLEGVLRVPRRRAGVANGVSVGMDSSITCPERSREDFPVGSKDLRTEVRCLFFVLFCFFSFFLSFLFNCVYVVTF